MKHLHIRHWSWAEYGINNGISPGSELCYDTMFGRGLMYQGISQWAWDILVTSEPWQSLSKAANELHAAVVAVLGKEAQP